MTMSGFGCLKVVYTRDCRASLLFISSHCRVALSIKMITAGDSCSIAN